MRESAGGPRSGPVARLARALSSARLAAWLMVALTVMSIVGLAIPQQTLFPAGEMEAWRRTYPVAARLASALALDRIFGSWYFFAAIGILMLSVSFCTWRRAAHGAFGRRSPFLSGRAAEKRGLAWMESPLGAGEIAVRAALALRAPWLKVHRREAGGELMVTWTGGTAGLAGSVLMHSAMILAATGAVLGSLTSLQGELILTEGQTAPVDVAGLANVRSVPRIGGSPGGFAVALDELALEYKGSNLEGARADMRVLDGERVITRTVRVNQPLEYGGASLLLGKTGYAARLIVKKDGKVIDDAFVTLHDRYEEGFGDRYRIPGGPELPILVVPDVRAGPRRAAATPYVLARPAAWLGSDETTMGLVGPLEVGGSGKIAGVEVTLADVRLWVVMMVRSNRGRPILYAGFWLMIMGMIVRFTDPRRDLMLVIRPKDRRSEVAYLGRSAYGRFGLGLAERALGRAMGVDLTGAPALRSALRRPDE